MNETEEANLMFSSQGVLIHVLVELVPVIAGCDSVYICTTRLLKQNVLLYAIFILNNDFKPE